VASNPPLDKRILSHPSRFAAIFVVVFLGLLSLLLAGILGLRPIPNLAPGSTITDSLTGLLALATSALAYASGLQARAAEDTRRGNIRPNLSLQILARIDPSDPSDRHAPLMHSPFFTTFPPAEGLAQGAASFRMTIRNMGPGNALNAWVWTSEWPVRVEDRVHQKNPDPPTGVPPLSSIYVVNDSLKVNEDYVFELAWAREHLPRQPNGPELESISKRLVVQAACRDVEGREVPMTRRGLDLKLMVPLPYRRVLDRFGQETTVNGPGWDLLWEMLTDEQLRSVPIGDDPRIFAP
jgi:hypothetical protein